MALIARPSLLALQFGNALRVREGPRPGTPPGIRRVVAMRASRVVFAGRKTEIRVREGPRPGTPLALAGGNR